MLNDTMEIQWQPIEYIVARSHICNKIILEHIVTRYHISCSVVQSTKTSSKDYNINNIWPIYDVDNPIHISQVTYKRFDNFVDDLSTKHSLVH